MKRILLTLLLCAIAATAQSAEKKPNVVLILIDDFGYECVTANGGESYKTPVMDQLAATGVRFEQVHVQPLCTPTRAALMTGITNKRNYTRFAHLDPKQTTFGNLFKNAGYATCITGKWQLGNGYEGPALFGFQENCLWQLVRRPGRYKNPGLEINGKQVDYTGNEYGPDLVNDYALDFITRKKDGPFFLYYPMMLTHDPYDATPDSDGYAKSESGKKKSPGHFPDMVTYADKLIGKLVAKLDELKLRENTVVIILGDNGTGRGTPSRFQGRAVIGGKGTSTNWGTRVPGIGNWPGHFTSGSVCRDMIDATDFLPTICEAAGVPLPAELKLDGRSFLSQLRGEKGSPRDGRYAWYSPDGGASAKFEFAHDQEFKLYADGRFYHVAKDDTEKAPLSDAALDDTARAAKAKLQALLKQNEGPREDYFVKQGTGAKGATDEKPEQLKPAAAPARADANRSARFDERDSNRDGKMTLEEFLSNQAAKAPAKLRFEKFDLNQDGSLTREEFINQGVKPQ